ncbi:TrbI F-type domain-containing protein [Roseobacter sp. HKCCD9010]|uniref:TrbI F-type domain-containing protein n=1 Tax=unclassified Roseobacter TaxID=196798 RepID=UPI0014912ED8|nr:MULTISPECIES: TrbI F-type domain-containing protein [unclassified Roseobacter]MBF9052269.1 TrbI F-type domain-containing protein [Rhodobacterales bacterium HKCCD4356]NNV14211.1 TrbI F-type domain-containing protein [Roseobacter sp. HKCCD7357]NNV18429.1 TrbI F-type domain-containing protein [Roseobacter sp. HKCCD8768]NNV27874.1 TrbI F-type domain-containing protein [Roseobacter sp. HKCCD8192]NNV32140.1 TrbI F-type domain-containing protein [Roseobacter sp. HKCCD9061]
MPNSQNKVSNADSFNITNIIGYFAGTVCLALVNVAITLTLLERTGNLGRPEVVSIDAADLIRAFVDAQGSAVSDEELQARVRVLNANLDPIVQAYAREHGLVIVSSDAVLAGIRDVTSEVLYNTGLLQ